jgi:predicted membrane chloride channel (bestrophin family)
MTLEEHISNTMDKLDRMKASAIEMALRCIMAPTADNHFSFKALKQDIQILSANLASCEAILRAKTGFGREVY